MAVQSILIGDSTQTLGGEFAWCNLFKRLLGKALWPGNTAGTRPAFEIEQEEAVR
jgi:hypothetical protein